MASMVCFGCGKIAKRYLEREDIREDIVAIIDNNPALWGSYVHGIPVCSPDSLKNLSYEVILILVSGGIEAQIKEQLSKMGISSDIIRCYSEIDGIFIWGYNHHTRRILLEQISGARTRGFIDPTEVHIGEKYLGVPVVSPSILQWRKYMELILLCGTEYEVASVREQLLQQGVSPQKISYENLLLRNVDTTSRILCFKDYARWINAQNLPGCVAECGVARGDSAKFLNQAFPKRKLYLFDTFSGFDERDILAERSLKDERFVNGSFNGVGLLSNPSVDVVMKKMTYPQQVVIRKGYFPESAAGIDEQFCFVSLDMDLYQPMLAALEFFWEKMVPGGCIALHDYFHPELPGVEKAVSDFEKKIEQRLPKAILGDSCSIAILK